MWTMPTGFMPLSIIRKDPTLTAWTDKDLYADNNLGGNTEGRRRLSSLGRALCSAEKPFTAVTLSPESAADTVTASLYKFVYSYERSLQGERSCPPSPPTKGADGQICLSRSTGNTARARVPARLRPTA